MNRAITRLTAVPIFMKLSLNILLLKTIQKILETTNYHQKSTGNYFLFRRSNQSELLPGTCSATAFCAFPQLLISSRVTSRYLVIYTIYLGSQYFGTDNFAFSRHLLLETSEFNNVRPTLTVVCFCVRDQGIVAAQNGLSSLASLRPSLLVALHSVITCSFQLLLAVEE